MMIRGFTILSQSWYADVNLRGVGYVDDVTFGMYDDTDGGTTGEMSIKWYELDGKSVPKLECFDDAWAILVEFTDVITMLGQKDNQNITPDKFAEILLSRGFKDLTKRPEKIHYSLYLYDSEEGFEAGNREHAGDFDTAEDARDEGNWYFTSDAPVTRPCALFKVISSDDEEIEIVRRKVTSDDERFTAFTEELGELSTKYGVGLQVTGGVSIFDPAPVIEYDNDPTSGDLDYSVDGEK